MLRSDDDVSSANEDYAKLDKSEVTPPTPVEAAAPVEPIAVNPPPANPNDNISKLIADIQIYLSDLYGKPVTAHPAIAALIPVVAWLCFFAGMVYPIVQALTYKAEIEKHPVGSPAWSEAYKEAIHYDNICKKAGFGTGFPLLGLTFFYFIFAFQRIYDGEKIPRHEWNHILVGLKAHVLERLRVMVINDYLYGVPDSLIPIDQKNWDKIQRIYTLLTVDQPRKPLIKLFLDLNRVLDKLNEEYNRRPIPMRLLEQIGNRNLPAPANEDLEAGTHVNPMAQRQ